MKMKENEKNNNKKNYKFYKKLNIFAESAIKKLVIVQK